MSHKKAKRVRKMEFKENCEALYPHLFNFERMRDRCTADIESFNLMVSRLPNGTVTHHGRESLAFIDNGADILGVAHLDATGLYPHFAHFQIGGPQGDEWVFSRWLDDRLGVFLLLDVLPRFCQFDMLLTTGEETGQSTAHHFKPPPGKTYRWMFEPDRMGDDCVHYQYDTRQLLAALREAGFSGLNHGSFTDIVRLEHLGVCGFNFGIGYHENHGDWSRANLTQTLYQCARFLKFYQTNAEVDFPFDPKAVKPVSYGWPRGEDAWDPRKDNRWKDARFAYHQIVRGPDGLLWQISGVPHRWGVDLEDKYWCCRPYSRNSAGSSVSKDWGVSELADDLTPEEVDAAKALFVDPVFIHPVQAALTEQEALLKEFDDLNQVTESSKVSWETLSHLVGGVRTDPKTVRARRIYEDKYFGPVLGVRTHHNEPPPDLLDYTFELGQAVYTPFGQAVIDSDYCVTAAGEEPHWWVRYPEPDKDGLVCHLEPDSTLSLVKALLARNA